MPPRAVVTRGEESDLEMELERFQPVEHVSGDEKKVEKGLARLVLGVVDLLVQLLERQAIRRMESGCLTEEQIEGMGRTFMRLRAKLDELAVEFGLDPDNLELSLPLEMNREMLL